MRMTQTAVQKEASPLAGLLVNVMVQSLKESVISRPITGSENLTKPDAVEYFSTINRTGGNLCLTDAREEFSGTLGSFVTSTRGEFKDTLRHFATNTRTGSIEFSESIKKGSTANATLCHDAGDNQALGSMPSFRSLSRQESLTHELKLPCPATTFICSKSESSKRMCFMVLPLRSNAFFSFSSCIGSYQYYNGNTDGNYHSRVKQYQSVKTTMPRSAPTLTGHLTTADRLIIEEAVMDITTHPQGREMFGLNSGHQHRHFVWIIAAVRRDNPALSPVIHHIAAENEREARRTLAKDNVCFFAGRLNIAAMGVSHA
ncbi:host cell division inhibitor Icd-like protein [Erwinia piriflorinigrans]|uniref:Phage immunity repressor protein n=1 Tax=Erwinia piriflorinigrans CFBP 5888 TaxID=1161919 RepID=V5Z3A5_9GAMM|nr:phage immunity repressor protein [Erwinia piriflorinigrans CFBP 5888]